MSQLPQVAGWEIIAALRTAGFSVVWRKGSHHFLRHDQDAVREIVVTTHLTDPRHETAVGLHLGDLPQETIRQILQKARMTGQELEKLLWTLLMLSMLEQPPR